MAGFKDIVLGVAIFVPYNYFQIIFHSYYNLDHNPKIYLFLALIELLFAMSVLSVLIKSCNNVDMYHVIIGFGLITFYHILYLMGAIMTNFDKLTTETQMICCILLIFGIIFNQKLLNGVTNLFNKFM